MIGQTISYYRILDKLGGEMGVVYKQRTSPHRCVAIKFLPEELTQDRQARERFQREAQAALGQPSKYLHDSTRSARGNQPFIAMDCFDGQTLKQLIAGIPRKPNSSLTSALMSPTCSSDPPGR